MPELPEVEHFRQLLLPLVTHKLQLELLVPDGSKPFTKNFLTAEQVAWINTANAHVTNVRRRGKQICLELAVTPTTITVPAKDKNDATTATKFLYLHMGMTGRITTPTRQPCFGHFSNTANQPPAEYPPPYTYLRLSAAGTEADACFSDPRKFGKVLLSDSDQDLWDLAPDALVDYGSDTALDAKVEAKLTQQSTGVKSILLDQKKVVSGVGNWVADEVLFQTEIHPDQSFLSKEQSKAILQKLRSILNVAVECLMEGQNYPNHWLFHVRWEKRKQQRVVDSHGRSVSFITSAGRTSAIVAAIQKNKRSQKQQGSTNAEATEAAASNRGDKEKKEPSQKISRRKRGDNKRSQRRGQQQQADACTETAQVASNRSDHDEKISGRKRTNRNGSRSAAPLPENPKQGNSQALGSTGPRKHRKTSSKTEESDRTSTIGTGAPRRSARLRSS